MNDSALPANILPEKLDMLANSSLHLWEMVPKGATARLINVSENTTYLVDAPGWKSVLRLHRENYHTEIEINSELSWCAALRREGIVATPDVYPGRDGKTVQSSIGCGLSTPQHMVMFHFVEGCQPDESEHMESHFEELGAIAARMHTHSIGWARPDFFKRHKWDIDTIFGANPTWGNWRSAPNITADIEKILRRAENAVIKHLSAFGKSTKRYGLIHADMRLANLLVSEVGTHLIDFDDCGMSWFLYDLAAGISFIEDHHQVPEIKSAWVRGYQKVRPLSKYECDQIDTFVMLRRLALLAWIGSHMESPEPQALAPDFACITAELATDYLRRFE